MPFSLGLGTSPKMDPDLEAVRDFHSRARRTNRFDSRRNRSSCFVIGRMFQAVLFLFRNTIALRAREND